MNEYINLFEKYGISLSEEVLKNILFYHGLLSEKNKVVNLTAITDEHEAMIKHYLDSLMLSKYCNLTGNLSLLDIGSGAGIPGIPLKIAYPDLTVTLLDSVNKKVLFQKEAAAALKLDKINSIHGRTEDLGHESTYREKYDIVTARAVANMSTLCEYCLPFVKTGGTFAAYKSDNGPEELLQAKNAIQLLGGKIKNIYSYSIENNNRSIIIIEKSKRCPDRYPRKAGIPSKNPL